MTLSENTENKNDILGNILDDRHTGSIRGINELTELICRPERRAHGVKKVRLCVPQKRKSRKKRKKAAAKRKTTHYLSEEVFVDLDEAKSIVRDLLPKGSKLKATKSRIVESAVKVLLDEFGRNGEESYLVKELLKKSKTDTDETLKE